MQLKEAVQTLFEEQTHKWELARNNYAALAGVRVRTLEINGYKYRLQFNPARIISSAAKVDEQSIRERKCFLCRHHLPPQQKGILFKERYSILVNPYPIFPQHLTIPGLSHTPQRLLPHWEDMLDLARELDNYLIFYNGPKCGASAPDHFHFQAGIKGFLPLEKDRVSRCPIVLKPEDKQQAVTCFLRAYQSLELNDGEDEPMLNVLVWYDRTKWTICLFPRKKHRPDCYAAEGEANRLISPASVDMGGVWVTPLEKDFYRITADELEAILQEICISGTQLQAIQKQLNK
jgi:hypothetical protein